MSCDVKKCYAECCGIVPIPKDTFEKNKHLIPEDEEVNISESFQNTVIAVRVDTMHCAFVDPVDYFCRIYRERPDVCRKFGEIGNNHPFLQCPYRNDTD